MNPCSENGAVNRETLTNRRRAFLYPNVDEQLDKFWNIARKKKRTESSSETKGTVAVVITVPPRLDDYNLVSRYTAGLISQLIREGVTPHLIDITPSKLRDESSKTIITQWGKSVHHEIIGSPRVQSTQGPLGKITKAPYQIYEWLKTKNYDVVHGIEPSGTLYFCLRAKKQGINLVDTWFVIHPVFVTFSKHLNEYTALHDTYSLPKLYLEKSTIELADSIAISDKSLLRNLLETGVSFDPSNIDFYPWTFVWGNGANVEHEKIEPYNINTVACLPGDSKQGVSLFCKALTRGGFNRERLLDSVIFIVPSKKLKEYSSYICALLKDESWNYRIVAVDGRRDLLQTLTALVNPLCFFPIIDDVNCYQLMDIAAEQYPVLVADKEKAAGILHPETPQTCYCNSLPDSIADRIHDAIHARYICDSKVRVEGSMPGSWFTKKTFESQRDLSPAEMPLVTICLMHFERPNFLEQAIKSINLQSYNEYEVVLVDDGSLKAESLQKLKDIEKRKHTQKWMVIRQNNLYLGAARNTAAMAAKGQYLYFLDDDNILKQDALGILVNVAEHVNADCVSSFSDAFEGEKEPLETSENTRRIVQIGDDLSYGLFKNAFGDSNALIRRESFLELGGNSEEYGVGRDDQEFFARAALNGYTITVVPEALYWARQMPTRLRNLHFNPNAGCMRVCKPYLSNLVPNLRPLILLSSGIIGGIMEGTDITFLDYLKAKYRQLASSSFGKRIRFSKLGPIIRKVKSNIDDRLMY